MTYHVTCLRHVSEGLLLHWVNDIPVIMPTPRTRRAGVSSVSAAGLGLYVLPRVTGRSGSLNVESTVIGSWPRKTELTASHSRLEAFAPFLVVDHIDNVTKVTPIVDQPQTGHLFEPGPKVTKFASESLAGCA